MKCIKVSLRKTTENDIILNDNDEVKIGRYKVTALSNEEEDLSISSNDFALVMQMIRLTNKPSIYSGSTSFPYTFGSINF